MIRRLGFLGLVVFITAACGPRPPATEPGLEVVPDQELKFGDQIHDVSLALDGDRIAYVVWSEQRKGVKAPAVWCRVRELDSGRWGPPSRLPTDEARQIRTAVIGGDLHVLAGSTLRYFVSNDRGAHWIDRGSLIGPGPFTRAWDTASDDSSLVVASVQPVSSTGRFARADTFAIWVVRAERNGRLASQVAVVPRPEFGDQLVRLLASRDSLYLLYGRSQNAVSADGKPGVYRPTTQISVATSGDGGRSWSPLVEMKAASDWESAEGGIHDLTGAAGSGRLMIFYAGNEVLALGRMGANPESAPAPVCHESREMSKSPSTVSSVTAVDAGTQGALVWIDTRYARTDRPFANPFSAQPDWSNNDVICLPLSRFRSNGWHKAQCQPQRLTRDLSYASHISVRASTTNAYALWSGLERVGKHLEDFKAPPRLFFARVPMN